MGKSAGEVRSEIEDTRQEMSETIDAIADRTSPARIIRRRRDRIGEAGGRSADGSWAAPRTPTTWRARPRQGRNRSSSRPARPRTRCSSRRRATLSLPGSSPSAAGLLLASLIPPSEAEQRVAGQVVEKAQPLRDELQRAGQDVAEDLRSTAQDGAEQVKQRASEAAETVQEDVRASATSVKEEAQPASP